MLDSYVTAILIFVQAWQNRNSCWTEKKELFSLLYSPTSPNITEPSNKFNTERSVCPVYFMVVSFNVSSFQEAHETQHIYFVETTRLNI